MELRSSNVDFVWVFDKKYLGKKCVQELPGRKRKTQNVQKKAKICNQESFLVSFGVVGVACNL
jgi:hypothetical protein